jgi:hypothetical protein
VVSYICVGYIFKAGAISSRLGLYLQGWGYIFKAGAISSGGELYLRGLYLQGWGYIFGW